MKAIWSNPSADPLQLPEFQAILPSDAQGGKVGKATKRRTTTAAPSGVLASGYEWLAKSAAREMQRAAQDFQKAPQKRGVDYELFKKDGSMWVHYKQHDAYWPSSRLNYTYQTNCVYLYEHQRGSISDDELKDHGLYLHVSCGEFALHLAASARPGDALPNLLKRYNVTAATTSCRTLFLIDVTYSMDALIEKTKNCIGSFFDRCARVLVEEGIDAGFELQIAGYSNYNVSAEELVERSTWETQPHNLAMFLRNLEVRGGWGPEAVEAGLMHALQEHKKRPLSQIILIGDAPPNPMSGGETIAEKRRRGYKLNGYFNDGEQYWAAQKPAWSEAGIPIKDAKGMLADLQAVDPVPLHAYYIKSRAEAGFRELAAASGGEAHPLDVNSKDGAQLLTDAVCKQILSSLGGESLADAYERMKPSFN
eukprot:Transcript_28520.p1 GENE.Transcript_28520~~Transcript_28520.p1  ORF type:complete len:422 (+),score=206.06 Transcript_28520:610-1875(+)